MKEIEALQEKISSLSVQLLSKPKGTICDIHNKLYAFVAVHYCLALSPGLPFALRPCKTCHVSDVTNT